MNWLVINTHILVVLVQYIMYRYIYSSATAQFCEFDVSKQQLTEACAETQDWLLYCVRFRCADAHTSFAERTCPSTARSDGQRHGVELAPYDDNASCCADSPTRSRTTQRASRRYEMQRLRNPGGSVGARLRDDENSTRSYRCDKSCNVNITKIHAKNQRRLRGRFLPRCADRRRTMRSTFFPLAVPLRQCQ